MIAGLSVDARYPGEALPILDAKPSFCTASISSLPFPEIASLTKGMRSLRQTLFRFQRNTTNL